MAYVTTSVQVRFELNGTEEGASILTAEVDGRPCGANKGKSSFRPGDTVYIAEFHSSNVTNIGYFATAGTFSPGAPSTTPPDFQVDDIITFVDSDSASLSYPANSGAPSLTWLGSQGFALSPAATLENQSRYVLTNVPADEAHYAAVARLQYKSKPNWYKLQSPDKIGNETSFEIVVLFWGEVAGGDDGCS